MIVEVNTIEEFCNELRLDADSVLGRIVRVRIDDVPDNEDATSHTVGLWATTVIRQKMSDTDEMAYILQLGVIAGSDFDEDSPNPYEIANDWRNRIAEVCDDNNLSLRNGKIEQF